MPEITTVREQLAWAYANLARAHAALNDGSLKYTTKHHIIRARLYHGLINKTMSIGSIYDDEKSKLLNDRFCEYCGSVDTLSLDHLLPRSRLGTDDPSNLIICCGKCNSSKGDKDLLEWYYSKNKFPTILVIRRYIKNIIIAIENNDLIDANMDDTRLENFHFKLKNLPFVYPPLSMLRITMKPKKIMVDLPNGEHRT